MKTYQTSMILMAMVVTSGVLATADEKHHGKASVGDATFEKIKALSGEWEVTHGPGEHVPPGSPVTYKVTAGGSAVLETLFGGSDHEMLTLYYMDRDQLALTHYCVLQNRPQMRAVKSATSDKIVFKCQEGVDKKLDAEDHMHQLTLTFIDADHVKADWVMYKGGKSDSTHAFELARKKKAD